MPVSTPTPARVLLLLFALGLAIGGCRREGSEDIAAVDTGAEAGESREIVPGIVRPEARFEVAPEVGARFPDLEIHDAEGQPVRIRELAARKPYTVLTLGCLT